jgi:hypothetical protein
MYLLGAEASVILLSVLCALQLNSATALVQTVHVGDRFTVSGNDSATRDCCAILWVASPEETGFFVDMLLVCPLVCL